MTDVGKQSVKASKEIKSLSTIDKNNLLLSIAKSIRDEKDKIICYHSIGSQSSVMW